MQKIDFAKNHVELLWQIVRKLPEPHSQWVTQNGDPGWESWPLWKAPTPAKHGMRESEYKERRILLAWLLTYAANFMGSQMYGQTAQKPANQISAKQLRTSIKVYREQLGKYLAKLKGSKVLPKLNEQLSDMPLEFQAFILGNHSDLRQCAYIDPDRDPELCVDPVVDYVDTMHKRACLLEAESLDEPDGTKHNPAILLMCIGAATTLNQAGIA